MADAVHRLTNPGYTAGHARRSLIVNQHDGFDRMVFVRPQPGFRFCRVSALPPVARHVFDLDAEPFRHLPPELRKMPCLEHEHTIARRERINNGRLPGSGTGSGIHNHGTSCLEDRPETFEYFHGQFGEFRTAMIDNRLIHGAKDPVWDVGRPWNLQKVPASVMHNLSDRISLDPQRIMRNRAY